MLPTVRMLRLLSLGLIFALLFMTAADAEITYSKQVGGSGGGAFEDSCNAGDLLVGFTVVAGKALNLVQPLCQAVDQNGGLMGEPYPLHTWGQVNPNGSFQSEDTVRCPGNQAVKSLHIWVDGNQIVHHVRTSCYPLLGGQGIYLAATANTGGIPVTDGSASCPAGMFAIGMTGASGALVDRLGLKCQAHSYQSADNTPPPPPPQPLPSEVKGTTADFAGVWETVVPEVHAHYQLTLVVNGNDVTGAFLNEEDTKYNGTLTGKATGMNGARLDYTYTQPGVNASGGGFFIVSAGKTLAGFTHADGSTTQYGWEGHRVGDASQATPPPPKQGSNTRTVATATTIYDQPENGNDVAYLNPGDTVSIVECPNGPESMCQISKPQAGWVYGGDLNP